MVYSRCKCGNRKHYGSGMSPPKCTPCEKCGSVPASGPNSHPDPVEHDFCITSRVETDEGYKTLTLCRYCWKSKAQIERANALRTDKGIQNASR